MENVDNALGKSGGTPPYRRFPNFKTIVKL